MEKLIINEVERDENLHKDILSGPFEYCVLHDEEVKYRGGVFAKERSGECAIYSYFRNISDNLLVEVRDKFADKEKLRKDLIEYAKDIGRWYLNELYREIGKYKYSA